MSVAVSAIARTLLRLFGRFTAPFRPMLRRTWIRLASQSTSQNETIDFDVAADGRSVTNFTTGQVNQGCTPPFHLSGGRIALGSYLMQIGADGGFGLSYSGTGSIGGTIPAQGSTSITGHFNGPVSAKQQVCKGVMTLRKARAAIQTFKCANG